MTRRITNEEIDGLKVLLSKTANSDSTTRPVPYNAQGATVISAAPKLIAEIERLRTLVASMEEHGKASESERNTLHATLRRVLESIGNGSGCTEEASIQFMQKIPEEVEAVVGDLQKEVSRRIDQGSDNTEFVRATMEKHVKKAELRAKKAEKSLCEMHAYNRHLEEVIRQREAEIETWQRETEEGKVRALGIGKLERYDFVPGHTCQEDCHADVVSAVDGKWVRWEDVLSVLSRKVHCEVMECNTPTLGKCKIKTYYTKADTTQ